MFHFLKHSRQTLKWVNNNKDTVVKKQESIWSAANWDTDNGDDTVGVRSYVVI